MKLLGSLELIDLGRFSHEPDLTQREKSRVYQSAEKIWIYTVMAASFFELKRSPNVAHVIFNRLVMLTMPDVLVQPPMPIAKLEIGEPTIAEFETDIRTQKASAIAKTLTSAMLGLGQDIPVIHSEVNRPHAWRASQSEDDPAALLQISFGLPPQGKISALNRAGYTISTHDIAPALPPNILYQSTKSG